MAIRINPGNFGGLQALAGMRIGNLGLRGGGVPRQTTPLAGIAQGLQAFMGQRDKRKKEALAMQQLQRRNRMQDMAMDLKQKRFEFEKTKFQKGLDVAAAKQAEVDNEEKLEAKAGAGMGWLSLSPEEKEEHKSTYIDGLRNKGIISGEAADKMHEMTPKQLDAEAKMSIYTSNKAMQYLKSQQKKPGQTINVNVDTGNKKQPLTKPNLTSVQKDIDKTLSQLVQLEQAGKTYSKEYLTLKGRAKDFMGKMSSLLGNEDAFTTFREKSSEFKSILSRYLTAYTLAMSGVQYSEKELKMRKAEVINAGDDPAAFEGKMKSLVSYMKATLKAKQQLLEEGVPLDSEEFQTKFDSRAASILTNISGNSAKPDGYKLPSGQTATLDQMKEAAKKMGITVDELKSRLERNK